MISRTLQIEYILRVYVIKLVLQVDENCWIDII